MHSTEIEFATKITNTIFSFSLIGTGQRVVYDKKNGTYSICDEETGVPLQTEEGEYGLEFEDFVLIARNTFLDIVEEFPN